MKTIIFFILLITFNLSFSQQIKGIVAYYQSNGKPAAGIEVNAFGCNKTYSLDNGIFILECPNRLVGQPVRLSLGPTNNEGEQIELVNDAQLKYLTIPKDSDSSTIDLIVCYPGERDKAALKYYNLVEDELLGSISSNIKKVTKSLDNINLETEERKKLTDELNLLRSERDLAQQRAEELSDYIASINLPKANLLIRNAVNTIESGEGTEKALSILSSEALKKEEIESKVRHIEDLVKILDGYLLRINLLLPKFKYRDVIHSYIEIIRIIENNNFNGNGLATLYTSLAYIYFLDGQYSSSVKMQEKGMSLWLKEASYNEPMEADALKNMGVFNAAMGANEKGLKFLLKAKEIIEKSTDTTKVNALGTTYSLIGNTYIKLHDYKNGLEYLQNGVHVLESSKLEFDKTRILGIAYDNLAKGFKAVSKYENALDVQFKSIKLLESVHNQPNPELATVYNNTSALLIDLGRYKEAGSYMVKALKIRERILNQKHPQVIQSYLSQANILFQEEDYHKSLSIAQKVIDLLGSDNQIQFENLISAYQAYGFNLIMLKKFDRGLKEFTKGIELRKKYSPDDRLLLMNDYTNLGAVYFESGDFEKAKFYYDIALEINLQEFPEELANLGQLYWSLAQLYKKENLTNAYYYQKECDLIFNQIYPENHPLQEKLNDLLIELEVKKGAELYMNGEYSSSLEHFLFVVSEKPTFKIVSQGNTMPVFQFIGSCYYELEDYQKAIEAEKKAVDVYPAYKLENYYNAIGLSYFKIDKLDKAKSAFENYLEVAAKEWRPYRNLSMYYAEVKNVDLALQNLEKAIQFGFDDKKWLKKNKSFDYLSKNVKYKKLLKKID